MFEEAKLIMCVEVSSILKFYHCTPQVALRFKKGPFSHGSGAKDPGRVRLRFAMPWLVWRALR